MTERETYEKERREYWDNYPVRNIQNIKPSKDGLVLLSDAVKFVKSKGRSLDEVYVSWDICWLSSLPNEYKDKYLRDDMNEFDRGKRNQKKTDMFNYKNLIEEYGTLGINEIEEILKE